MGQWRRYLGYMLGHMMRRDRDRLAVVMLAIATGLVALGGIGLYIQPEVLPDHYTHTEHFANILYGNTKEGADTTAIEERPSMEVGSHVEMERRRTEVAEQERFVSVWENPGLRSISLAWKVWSRWWTALLDWYWSIVRKIVVLAILFFAWQYSDNIWAHIRTQQVRRGVIIDRPDGPRGGGERNFWSPYEWTAGFIRDTVYDLPQALVSGGWRGLTRTIRSWRRT